VAGAIASYTPSIVVYSIFALSVMLPSGLWLLFQDTRIDLAMGIMGVLFVLIMSVIARQQHHTLIENLGLHSEKEKLLLQLQASKERHKKAQCLAHMGHWELDASNRAMLWSDEACRIFEFTPEQTSASYELFLESIHPDDRERVDDAYQRSLENREPYDIEYRLLLPDGRIKWVHEQCEPEFAEDGALLRTIGTVQEKRGQVSQSNIYDTFPAILRPRDFFTARLTVI